MTDKKQPEPLRLAGIADDGAWTFAVGVRKQIAAELRRQHVELETLRTGYEAARLEIESLKAQQPGAAIQRYKIGYHADEWGQRSSTPSGIPDASGSWVRYADHVTALASQAQPVAQQGMAYAAMPEPLEIDWPELHSQALGCGVEDRGLHNRYECAEYGWQDGVDKCAERAPEQIFDADQMRAFADATCALRASHGQAPAQAAPQQEAQEPFGYVNTSTGQFFTDVEPCRKNNEGHWRTVYTAPQPSPAAQGDALDAAYAALMQAASDWICEHVPTGTRGATAWATKLQDAARALRASHGQAPAGATYTDSTPELHIGDSAFESWYSSYSPAHKSDKQRARDAYAAGMGDPLVTAAPAAVAGPSRDLHPEKCPITGRPFFMTLDHPELGDVPTYGGPYDSYTIPAPEGEPTDPWHERELRSERYDHDAGWWVEGGEPIPLRIVHEDVLFKLQEDAECAMLSGALRAAAQEPSHQSTQLAEMILSDCGFSSNYTPLLNRVAARIDAHVERCLESKKTTQQEAQEPSPTAGMNIAQRILHVGGRNPPGSTYVEFGSIQAVEALVKHVLRDLQPSPAAQVDALDAACQRACMELPEGMSMAIQLERDAGWIELHGSYGDQIELPNADGSLAEQVHQAIDAAITAARARLEDKS